MIIKRNKSYLFVKELSILQSEQIHLDIAYIL